VVALSSQLPRPFSTREYLTDILFSLVEFLRPISWRNIISTAIKLCRRLRSSHREDWAFYMLKTIYRVDFYYVYSFFAPPSLAGMDPRPANNPPPSTSACLLVQNHLWYIWGRQSWPQFDLRSVHPHEECLLDTQGLAANRSSYFCSKKRMIDQVDSGLFRSC